VLFSLLAALALGILWQSFPSSEPNYGGKRLSVWLDELSALDFSKRADTNTPQVQAVRSIGTNAIPWLMSELKRDGNPWEWRINHILQKQHFIKYRFPDRCHPAGVWNIQTSEPGAWPPQTSSCNPAHPVLLPTSP
jgi:hypothetical protein